MANYNGTGLIQAADMGIVVVTFNYRVGPYGFLAGEQIKEGGSINNGLKDQIKTLEWVQKHISKVCHFSAYGFLPLTVSVWRRSKPCSPRWCQRRSCLH